MNKLEQIQYQAALAVTSTWKGSNRVKLYEELGWESLSDRRMLRRILQIHKIVDNKAPLYLRNKLPPNRRNLVDLPYIFQEIMSRTSRYSHSFFPDAIKSWNGIISQFENFPTFQHLKSHVTSLICLIASSCFDLFDPPNIRYIFQLRIGLSKLRSHKKRHNFVDTPTDMCLCKQGKEDTSHFLLLCPFYSTHRDVLARSVNDILQPYDLIINDYVQLYLYGHSQLSTQENRSIIKATIAFIDKTKRFIN